MQRSKKPKNFLPKPIYPGGPKAMGTFIRETLRYPKEALKNKIEGTVVIRIDINFKGKVVATKVKSSVGYGCDEEAQRVVKSMKFEVESKLRKGRILFHKTLNISFKLPKSNLATTKEKPRSVTQTQLSYTVVPNKANATQSQKTKSNGSYTYVIKY